MSTVSVPLNLFKELIAAVENSTVSGSQHYFRSVEDRKILVNKSKQLIDAHTHLYTRRCENVETGLRNQEDK